MFILFLLRPELVNIVIEKIRYVFLHNGVKISNIYVEKFVKFLLNQL